jgi:hypothetical protein
MEVLPSSSFASLKDLKDVPVYPQYPPRRSCQSFAYSVYPLHSHSNVAALDYALAMNGGREISYIAPPLNRVAYVARGASLSPRAFAPLTPIIASPICTPSISTSSAYELEVQSESGQATVQDTQHNQLSSFTTKPIPTPSWTSTPPSPPSKQALRLVTSLTPRAALPNVSPSRSFPGPKPAYYASPSIQYSHRRHSHPPMIPLPPSLPHPHSWTNNSLHQTPEVNQPYITPIAPPRERSISPLFHIPHDGHSDNEDEENGIDGNHENSPDSTANGTSQGGSSTDRSSEGWEGSAKRKDDMRRYHALMELLTTEEGYLVDLRALVTVCYSFTLRVPYSNGSSVPRYIFAASPL